MMSNQKQPHKIKYIFIGNKTYEVINGFTIRKERNNGQTRS